MMKTQDTNVDRTCRTDCQHPHSRQGDIGNLQNDQGTMVPPAPLRVQAEALTQMRGVRVWRWVTRGMGDMDMCLGLREEKS